MFDIENIPDLCYQEEQESNARYEECTIRQCDSCKYYINGECELGENGCQTCNLECWEEREI